MSFEFQNSCALPSGYDQQTCSCPDGTSGGCDGEFEICDQGYAWSSLSCSCESVSPIVIDLQANGFAMTNVENGVVFDINSDGIGENLSWIDSNSDDFWLALDRNSNGRIDNGAELFGSFTEQPDPPIGERRNGFLALAEFDRIENGGNNDGKINIRDSIFIALQLWHDSNQNGVSEPSELFALSELGLAAMDLDYRSSRRTDQYGNKFRWRARVRGANGAQLGRWAWDVILVTGN